MAEFVLADLPRELEPAETKYLTELCSDVVRRWEWERERPSHLCKRRHAGALVRTVDRDEAGAEIRDADGRGRSSAAHAFEPHCHDCGRDLHRPPGSDEATWICPNARAVLPAGGPDTAIECGEAR